MLEASRLANVVKEQQEGQVCKIIQEANDISNMKLMLSASCNANSPV